MKYCTASDTWMTDETLPSMGATSTWSPAIVGCYRYAPMGTKPGDWYLPSAGEIGYLGARFDYVNGWIDKLSAHFEIELGNLPFGEPFWTSTFYSNDKAIKLDTEGRFERQTLTTSHVSRPFMRGMWKGRKEYVPKVIN